MKNNKGGTFGMDFGDWDRRFNQTDWILPAIKSLKKAVISLSLMIGKI